MFIELLRKRRSIRRFAETPVEQEKIALLVEAALRSPSSRGINPWHFIVVTKAETRQALAQAKPHGGSFIRYAPLTLVICADPGKSDVWIEDTAIATTILHLAATDLGLGSCWVQIRNRMHNDSLSSERYISELLGLPAGTAVLAMLAIGYPLEEKAGHSRESLLFEQVSYEHFASR